MWLYTLGKAYLIRYYTILKAKLSKEYRISKTLERKKINALNSFSILMKYHFPFKDYKHFYSLFSKETFYANRVNYEVYDNITKIALDPRRTMEFFIVPEQITRRSFRDHDREFKEFLQAYREGLIQVALHNRYHSEEHIYTEPMELLGSILISMHQFYNKNKRESLKSALFSWLDLSI